MPDSIHHQTTQQMIAEIEKKDRRFRFAQSIFMALLIVGFIAGGFLSAQAYNSEQKKRDAANAAVIDAVNKKLDQQSQQLLCIAKFFTRTSEERADTRIKSVDDCVLENTETGKQSSAPAPEGNQSFLVPGRQDRPQTQTPPSNPGNGSNPEPQQPPGPIVPPPTLLEQILDVPRRLFDVIL